MSIEENGVQINKFYPLKLEISQVNTLTLNWTVVHKVVEESPLFDLSAEDLRIANAEILVLLKGFDDTFSNTVIARSSYRAEEIVFGAKFLPMYYKDAKRGTTVLNMDQLNAFEKVDISFSKMMK
ncbi:hypothetical protein, partial [Raoultella terrigena]|uniref:hypothetical protein n=1 Tax=Raoultella terrigena TaxID=577 RepID=UPI001C70A970